MTIYTCIFLVAFKQLKDEELKSLWVGFNSRWGSIVSIFVFGWGSINIFMGWGCNQEWGSNGADTVVLNLPFVVTQCSGVSQAREFG